MANLERPPKLNELVRAASKMSVQALVAETGGSEEDAEKIITVGCPLNSMGVHKGMEACRLGAFNGGFDVCRGY